MNGYVSKLCDIDSIAIPEHLLHVEVDEREVETQVRALSLRCAEETEGDRVENGDVVWCKADAASYPDGRTILLFTGTAVPGAEEAVTAAMGRAVGACFTTELSGKPVELTVEKIIRREPVEVTDALIAGLGIEGVATVAEYRAHLRAKLLADLRMECGKQISGYFVDQMTTGSTYEYDEAEMEQYVQSHMDECIEQAAAEGESVTPEMVRESLVYQMKQGWMAEAFCKSHGIAINTEDINAQLDQMTEMMSLMGEEVPDRQELFEMVYQGECLNALFDCVDEIIARKKEDTHGND